MVSDLNHTQIQQRCRSEIDDLSFGLAKADNENSLKRILIK